MKKIIILSILFSVMAFSAMADQGGVLFEFHKNDVPKQSTEVNRSLVNPIIEAFYDSTTATLTIETSNEIEGEVYLYDTQGKFIDYSPCINTNFFIESGNSYIILIIGDVWYAEGCFYMK